MIKLRVKGGKCALPSQMVRLNVNEVGWVTPQGCGGRESIFVEQKSRYYLGDVCLKGEGKKIPL